MKKTVLTLTILFILTSVFAQKTELGLSLNSGLFSFAGKSSEATSFINSNVILVPNTVKNQYTNNPYGSRNGLCYGISANVKRVTKWNFIYGIEAGYEVLRSKVTINEINEHLSTTVPNSQYAATGKTNLNFDFINLHPFAGYRFMLKQVHVDITGGLDIARCLKAKENGNAETVYGQSYNTSVDRKTITTDIRPRVQLSAGYKKFGAYLGYSAGLKNYKEGYDGGTNESYSRILRFGVTYRLF